MTPYDSLFQMYGRPSKDGRVRIDAYFQRPDQLDDASRIAQCDKSAQRVIAECQEAIEAMQAYRQQLARRYAELETMPYQLRLELQRVPLYDGHKVYNIRLIRTYADGSEVVELRESYKGKDRREALARFDALCKSRPGIEIVKDIEKRQWER